MSKDRDTQPKNLSMKANLAISTLYQVLIIITPFITASYISYVLGSDNVGTYSYTAAFQMYFAMVASLGTSAYGTREISRNRKDKATYSKLFWEIELLTVFTTAAVLLLWGAWIVLHAEDRIYYIILTISIVAVLFDISWFYAGLEQFRYTVTVNSVCKLISVAAIFIFVKERDDLPIYVTIMSATALVSNASMWIYLPRFLGPFEGRLTFGKHFKETLIYFIPTVATSIYTVLDKSLIKLITQDKAENANYEQATKIINMMKAVTFSAMNAVFGSRIAFLFEEGKHEEIKEKIELSISYILFMGVGIGFGLAGVVRHFVPMFFGPEFGGVVPLLYIFGPIVVIIGISNCLGSQYYTPAGLRKQSSRYIIIGAVVNLALNLVLIRFLKANGAAIASVIAELTIAILYLIHCNGYLTLSIIWKHLWRDLIAGGVMFGIVWIIGALITHHLVAVIVQVIVGILIYVLLLVLMRDPFIRNTALKMVKDKLHRRKVQG